MVTVIFKLSEAGSVEIAIDQPETLQDILSTCTQKAGITLGGFIAVRNGKVIRADSLVEENDIIEVFPAISGG